MIKCWLANHKLKLNGLYDGPDSGLNDTSLIPKYPVVSGDNINPVVSVMNLDHSLTFTRA